MTRQALDSSFLYLSFCSIIFYLGNAKLDYRLRFKSYGYISKNNSGPYEGCCAIQLDAACQPCQYQLNIIATRNDSIFSIEVGRFKKVGQELYETFTYSLLDYEDQKTKFYPEYRNVWQPNSTIDKLEEMYVVGPVTYTYGGTLGSYNRIYFFAKIEIDLVDRSGTFISFCLIVHSIFFKKYSIWDGQCCSLSSTNDCDIPCDYTIYLKHHFSDLVIKEQSAYHEGRKKDIAAHFCFDLSKGEIKFDLAVHLTSVDKAEVIDFIDLHNLRPNASQIVNYDNMEGYCENVAINVTYELSCETFFRTNCSQPCNEVRYVEYCDKKLLSITCLNMADDSKTCENEPLQKCSSDLCKNDGICKVFRNKTTCICSPGYRGKFCQTWFCKNDCNGNGRCIGPNTCDCDLLYDGDNCDRYTCYFMSERLNGIIDCWSMRDSVTCICKKKLITYELREIGFQLRKSNSPCFFNDKPIRFLCEPIFPPIMRFNDSNTFYKIEAKKMRKFTMFAIGSIILLSGLLIFVFLMRKLRIKDPE